MLPGLTFENRVNGANGHAKLLCKLLLGQRSRQQTNGAYLRIRQLRLPLAFTMGMAFFVIGVRSVVSVCTCKQVVWPATGWIVAVVTDKQISR